MHINRGRRRIANITASPYFVTLCAQPLGSIKVSRRVCAPRTGRQAWRKLIVVAGLVWAIGKVRKRVAWHQRCAGGGKILRRGN